MKELAPFDRLQDPDPTTHAYLARIITGTCGARQNAYVTINNKAEGCAPLSVMELGLALTVTSQHIVPDNAKPDGGKHHKKHDTP